MRRPLKPFVTEYKTAPRRSKDAFDMPGPSPTDAQPDYGTDTPIRPFMPADDSSYEAAMRAADALFSGTSKAHPTVYETASEAFKPAEAPTAPSRRILEAIDETPADPFAALEAERAPKRRGRKPGSKNKPKFTPVPVDIAAVAITMAKPAAAPPSPKFKPAAIVERALAPVTESRAPSTPAPRTYVPYSWVRTRLRPGEKWKLRIPKVAW